METMLPTAMVPGLVTVKGPDGKTQNVFPIDAKDLLKSGYEVVDNGAIEAARMNANPLRSGRAYAAPEQVIVEVTGIEGQLMASTDEKVVSDAIAAGDSPDNKAPAQENPAGTKPEPKPEPAPKAEQKPAAKPADAKS